MIGVKQFEDEILDADEAYRNLKILSVSNAKIIVQKDSRKQRLKKENIPKNLSSSTKKIVVKEEYCQKNSGRKILWANDQVKRSDRLRNKSEQKLIKQEELNIIPITHQPSRRAKSTTYSSNNSKEVRFDESMQIQVIKQKKEENLTLESFTLNVRLTTSCSSYNVDFWNLFQFVVNTYQNAAIVAIPVKEAPPNYFNIQVVYLNDKITVWDTINGDQRYERKLASILKERVDLAINKIATLILNEQKNI